MNTPAFLEELRRRGVGVRLKGDDLALRDPRGALTPTVLSTLQEVKPQLVALLREEWDEAAAWGKVQEAVRALPDLVPTGGIGWAEANHPELLEVCDQAEERINATFAEEDRPGLDEALQQFTDAYRALGMEFGGMSPRGDIPDQAGQVDDGDLLALFGAGEAPQPMSAGDCKGDRQCLEI